MKFKAYREAHEIWWQAGWVVGKWDHPGPRWEGPHPDHDRDMTLLYSIRAQARGRLHRHRAALAYHEFIKLPVKTRLVWTVESFQQHGGRIKFDLSLEDQAAYVGHAGEEFWREVEAVVTSSP